MADATLLSNLGAIQESLDGDPVFPGSVLWPDDNCVSLGSLLLAVASRMYTIKSPRIARGEPGSGNADESDSAELT